MEAHFDAGPNVMRTMSPHRAGPGWRRVGRSHGVVSAVVILGLALGVAAQSGYEAPSARLQASAILPSDLIKGPHHQVADDVVNDGYMNHYRIGSSYGDFTAASTAELRTRIREIGAIAAMTNVEATSEFASSFEASAKRDIQGIEKLVTQPTETIQGAVSGVSRLFDRATESLFGSSRSQAEGARWQDVVGYAKTKREIARQFGVDVYSRNAVLQEHLGKIAQANYWGGLSMGAVTALVPGAAGAFVSVSDTSRLLNDALATKPPTDLRAMNRQKLAAMRVEPNVAELFIDNAVFSPRQQTLLVGALEEMTATADRGSFVRIVVPTHEPDLAFFQQRRAEMYAGYVRNVGPIERFVQVGHFAVGRTPGRAMVVCAPVDHVLWTEALARVAEAFGRRARELGLGEKHLWLTGTASPMAREQLRQQGWTLHEQSETRLWARR